VAISGAQQPSETGGEQVDEVKAGHTASRRRKTPSNLGGRAIMTCADARRDDDDQLSAGLPGRRTGRRARPVTYRVVTR
jgi:hypothetical protein